MLACLPLAVLALLLPPPAWAHGIVGDRMFLEPLFAEDANIKNELNLPKAEFLGMPDGTFRSLEFSLEKALWPDRWSVVVEQGRVYRHENGRSLAGFDNLELGMKFAAYRNERREWILTPALFASLATGSLKLGERHTALEPGILFGKGFGDVKPKWLRPLAIQGDFRFEASLSGPRERHLVYDAVLEYSIPYLNHFVRQANAGYEVEHTLRRGHSLRAILGDLFPFLEVNASTPVGGTEGSTASFLRPGVCYMGKYIQLSLAADFPVRGGPGRRRAGAVILLDFFLDEISPAFRWTPFGKRHHHSQHSSSLLGP